MSNMSSLQLATVVVGILVLALMVSYLVSRRKPDKPKIFCCNCEYFKSETIITVWSKCCHPDDVSYITGAQDYSFCDIRNRDGFCKLYKEKVK